ncbi:MAG: acyl-CoA thioesterase [Actinobacteria bacterium]|nr:acyl-CoA thioesterase [Actinomycetota bacterium]
MAFEPRFRNTVRVRYGECDQQGVVFNAHYLAYVDDTLERWMHEVPNLRDLGWDMMLKRAEIVWHGSARSGETLDIDAAVTRWGNTSWEVAFLGAVDGAAIFVATVLYVSVVLDELTPMTTPAEVIAAFGAACDPPV